MGFARAAITFACSGFIVMPSLSNGASAAGLAVVTAAAGFGGGGAGAAGRGAMLSGVSRASRIGMASVIISTFISVGLVCAAAPNLVPAATPGGAPPAND